MIKPAAGGTKEIELGVLEFVLIGSSFENKTFKFFISSFFNSVLITRAKGQTDVFEMSVIMKPVGSSLFPVPIDEMIFVFKFLQVLINKSFDLTESITSII